MPANREAGLAVLVEYHLPIEASVDRIESPQVREVLGIGQVVDGHDHQLRTRERQLEKGASDSSRPLMATLAMDASLWWFRREV